MSAILKLIQGSLEWHAHRSHYRNASESAAVMGLSPWQTPYQLWLVRTGRMEVAVTAPMRHGSAMEPTARTAYEARSGLVMQPLVMVDREYSASLDGVTLEGDRIVEIKCPYKGQASDLWQTVTAGAVPEYYQVQVQHQLMVSGATHADLFVFDGTEGLMIEITRDETCMEEIRQAWDAFQVFLDTDAPPPLSDRDTVQRHDPAWAAAASEYLACRHAADEAAKVLETARERLVNLANHASESGAGVTVTRFWKQGSVDYKKVPELKGVNVDDYRKPGTVEVRVSVSK